MKPAFDEGHTALFRDVDTMPPIVVVRDSAYLTWRYPPLPASPYLQREIGIDGGVEATVVVRIAQKFGLQLVFVMEWLWRRGRLRDGLHLMKETVRLAGDAGAHGVVALAMPGTVQRRLLRQLGFFGIPEALFSSGITLVVRVIAYPTGTQRWFEPSNWYLTFGDGVLL
jgi:hypothetical protein